MQLNYPMKKNGMYLLKKTDFDDIATQVLTEYMPSVFHTEIILSVCWRMKTSVTNPV